MFLIIIEVLIDFYDEVFLLIQSLIMNYVSEPMWKVFDMVYHIVKNDNSCTIVFSGVFCFCYNIKLLQMLFQFYISM